MATPVFCCGFECGLAAPHWATLQGSSAPTFTTTSPLSGSRSMRFAPSAGTSNAVSTTTFGAGQMVLRFRINFTTLPSATCALATFSQTGAGVYFKQSDSSIYAGNSEASLGSTGVSVTTGVTYYIDVKVATNATPWSIDVNVSGTSCATRQVLSGANTNASSISLGPPTTGSSVTANFLIDDVCLSTTLGDYPLGDGYVNHFVPIADGSHNISGTGQFRRTASVTDITNSTTNAYLLVDSIPLLSGSPSEYINLVAPVDANAYAEVVFGPAPGISTPTAAPRGVEVIVVSAAASTTTNNLRLALNDNGSLDDVRNATVGSTSCIYNRKHYTDPPSAATTWTVTSGDGNFNNLRMRCFSSDANPDPYFAGAMIEAEFAAVTAATFMPIPRQYQYYLAQ